MAQGSVNGVRASQWREGQSMASANGARASEWREGQSMIWHEGQSMAQGPGARASRKIGLNMIKSFNPVNPFNPPDIWNLRPNIRIKWLVLTLGFWRLWRIKKIKRIQRIKWFIF